MISTHPSTPPAAPASRVRLAADDDHTAVARVLTRAFLGDPVFDWMFPRPRTRAAMIERFFGGLVLDATAPHDTVWTTDGVSGAALWEPPGAHGASLVDQLRMVPETVRVCWPRPVRALRAMGAFELHHPEVDHWYLWFVGVAPEQQGRGIGTALLQPVLDRCDASRMPAYVDATTRRNRALYERLGFETIAEVPLPGRGGPSIWPMWREPS